MTASVVNRERVKEILNGGKTNDLKNSGVLINDPDAVLVGELDDGSTSELYGTSGSLSQSDVDYVFHRGFGVTLSEKKEFYRENDPKLYVYTITEGTELRREVYTWVRGNEEWSISSHTVLEENTDAIPEEIKWSTWQNFGDMSPREHGGIFVKWEDSGRMSGHWHIIATRVMQDERQEGIGEKYMGLEMYFSPKEIWDNPNNLEEGIDEDIRSRLSVLGMGDVDPTEAEEIVRGIAQIPMEFNPRDFYFSNYWERLKREGIYQSTVT